MKKVNCFGELYVGRNVWLRAIGTGIVEKLKVENVTGCSWDDSIVYLRLSNGMKLHQIPKNIGTIVCSSVFNDVKINSFFLSVDKLS